MIHDNPDRDLKMASAASHGNCAFLDRLGWTVTRCRVCDKLALVPKFVITRIFVLGLVLGMLFLGAGLRFMSWVGA